MHRRGTGFMAFFTHVPPAVEDEYVRFLADEHMPERLRLPGFVRARLFRSIRPATEQGRPYMALYETQSLAVLTSAAYVERLGAPSAWTRAFMPQLSGSLRGAGVSLASSGCGAGSHISVIRTSAEPGDGAAAELAKAAKLPRMVGARLLKADLAASSVRTPGTAKEGPRLTFSHLVIAEAGESEGAARAADLLAGLFPATALQGSDSFQHDYVLAFSVDARDVEP